MVRQFLMGGFISICNITIHALIMTAVVRASQATVARAASRPNLLLIAVMVATVSVLMAAHTSEVIVWSLAYGLVDATPTNSDRLYFAFVNYTTLGYGDVLPTVAVARADDGNERSAAVWTTAVIFEVLRKVMMRRASAQERHPTRPEIPKRGLT